MTLDLIVSPCSFRRLREFSSLGPQLKRRRILLRLAALDADRLARAFDAGVMRQAGFLKSLVFTSKSFLFSFQLCVRRCATSLIGVHRFLSASEQSSQHQLRFCRPNVDPSKKQAQVFVS